MINDRHASGTQPTPASLQDIQVKLELSTARKSAFPLYAIRTYSGKRKRPGAGETAPQYPMQTNFDQSSCSESRVPLYPTHQEVVFYQHNATDVYFDQSNASGPSIPLHPMQTNFDYHNPTNADFDQSSRSEASLGLHSTQSYFDQSNISGVGEAGVSVYPSYMCFDQRYRPEAGETPMYATQNFVDEGSIWVSRTGQDPNAVQD